MTASATKTGFRFVDADGHALEPPTGLQEFSPAEYRDRVWHVETDADGQEWVVADGPSTFYMTFHDAATSNIDVLRSQDGGMTWLPVGTATSSGCPTVVGSS